MHIYLHVPFCARRCSYCDFAIAVRREVPSGAYADAILQEWALWQSEPVWEQDPEIQTIYFGGGTPSRISAEAVARLLDRITGDRPVASDAEITLEANPDDVTLPLATAWRAAGVNRVSLGVQSFDPAVLRWMHRVHTADHVPRAVEALRRADIENLSLDLIFGLPASLGRDWEKDLARAFSLQPEHLSLYGLTVEPHTVLGHQAGRGELTPVDEEQYAAEFLAAHRMLLSHGYDHYEVSNAALPGYRSRHNSAYWRRATFIGLGPSAHSGHANERCWNVREWAAYERAVTSGASPIAGRERLDPGAIRLEEVYLGLRTSDGLPAGRLRPDVREQWEKSGWASCASDRLHLTPEGWLRLDALVPAGDS
ncbi:MAG TPA: radical SAM family heme chaperone HemW [Gemmatimonadales bacterium]|nr:radical SAM family heme chaperone HemW [Gemmatimonadales bacterium]